MTQRSPFRYFKTSPEIIGLAVMLYVRFPLSLRNVEDLLHERGVDVSHETVRFNEHLFANLRHARHLIAAWREDYNHHRPHTSLDGLTPWEYHQRSKEDQTLNRANL